MTETIKPGLYRLRSVTVDHPNPGPGGMYATGNGVDEPVKPFPQSPPFMDRQIVCPFRISATLFFRHLALTSLTYSGMSSMATLKVHIT